MMPTHSPYGGWAAGGEIDIVESRGNKVHETLGALHFGGKWPDNVHLDHTYRFPGKNAAEDSTINPYLGSWISTLVIAPFAIYLTRIVSQDGRFNFILTDRVFNILRRIYKKR